MLEQFETHGWVRVPAAFTADEAAAMRDATWRALEAAGVSRDDPSTWTHERPDHLQRLKKDPVFAAVGSARTIDAIDTVLQRQPWNRPRDWGAFFVVFPTPGREWSVAHTGWHCDADYRSPLSPARGVKVHAMYSDVEPRGGGMNIVSGSHRLVHRWFAEHPAPASARSARLRKSLLQHPHLRALCQLGDPSERISTFGDRVTMVDGVPVQVIENTARAGDVILMHPLLLHAPPVAHLGAQPRFLLNKDLVVGS